MLSEKISNMRIVLDGKCKFDDPFKAAQLTSLITVEVQPQNDGALGGDETRKISLSKNSFEGGDCMRESENCLFWPYEVSKANCSGTNILFEIPGNNPHKDLVCRTKCIANV
jgi:hypothetical protein